MVPSLIGNHTDNLFCIAAAYSDTVVFKLQHANLLRCHFPGTHISSIFIGILIFSVSSFHASSSYNRIAAPWNLVLLCVCVSCNDIWAPVFAGRHLWLPISMPVVECRSYGTARLVFSIQRYSRIADPVPLNIHLASSTDSHFNQYITNVFGALEVKRMSTVPLSWAKTIYQQRRKRQAVPFNMRASYPRFHTIRRLEASALALKRIRPSKGLVKYPGEPACPNQVNRPSIGRRPMHHYCNDFNSCLLLWH